jgi:hypothetical protein
LRRETRNKEEERQRDENDFRKNMKRRGRIRNRRIKKDGHNGRWDELEQETGGEKVF